MSKIKVVLADDHNLVRDGIRYTLESKGSIEVVGEASDGLEAIEKVRDLKPDVAVLDITMPEMNGLEAAESIIDDSKTKVLMLSMHDKEDYISQAVKAGASGYILKDSSKDELINAVEKVAAGEKFFSSTVSNILANVYLNSIQGGTTPTETDSQTLTRRESDILKRIVNGSNNREIADELDLSVRTVEAHRFKIMKKLGVKNAAELVKVALEKSLV